MSITMPTSVPSAAGTTIAWPREREIPPQGAPLPKGTVVVSADSHIMETCDLWKDRLPARFGSRTALRSCTTTSRASRTWRLRAGCWMCRG